MRVQAWSVWRSAKPWAEFGNTAKMNVPVSASEVQQRLSDNLTYFASNYALCFIALSCVGVLVHPVAFICIVGLAALYVALFMQQGMGVGMIAPLRGPHRHNARVVTFAGVTFATLYVTDAVGIIGSWMVLAGVMSVVHAACRVSAKEPDFESPVVSAV